MPVVLCRRHFYRKFPADHIMVETGTAEQEWFEMREVGTVQDVLQLFSQPTAEWFLHTLGEPTQVQKEAWPQIAAGRPVLVSAPTGTGKTLTAFLFFIDRLQQQMRAGQLKEGLQIIYISPLKSLAADIRENLQRPLDGINARPASDRDGGEGKQDGTGGRAGRGKEQRACAEISVAIRTGDTPQKERQRMYKHPPHILITTPESLFLMLTSGKGQQALRTAQAVVIDELHALIDTKRGAHLLFSIARLERLCQRRLQRIGLSATIEPLALAAKWLSPEEAAIVAPRMQKQKEIRVVGTTPARGRKRDPVWEELAQKVYDRCSGGRSVIAFSEGRRYAEKLSYYVNQIAGEDFSRVHHGSLSKQQRLEAETALREGRLKLLCATSSMELGIDVGQIDEVLQIGCPKTVSSAMQRLGRAGHGPGRVSVMRMYPRTAPEGLCCGMTAALAMRGSVEEARPPRLCLDVLAQHLVSMAAGGHRPKGEEVCEAAYSVDDVLALTKRTWTFSGVTRDMVTGLLRMLAGDYEHVREIPVRPRVLYDRIREVVYPDPYSRMLAVAAGGTIPDKGLYAAKTSDGVTLGELDEEFVYESRVGDRFLLGSFGWRIVGQDRDTVYVEPASADSARIPFWKGEIRGRSLKTGLAFGSMMAQLGRARSREEMLSLLSGMGLDDAAAQNAADFIGRQIAATGCLPDDKTIVAEHFCDHTGNHQIMLHSLFGRRINAPLAVVLQDVMRKVYHMNVGCVEEDDGILLYPYGNEKLPENILYSVETGQVRSVLEAALLEAPLFGITFRYNAARALMMGMRRNGRQPLWMQRLRSTEMLDSLIREKEHPLMAETRRECMEDLWDVEGLLWLLSAIRSGLIGVREVYVDVPSPMSIPLQWQAEAAEMYSYAPTTPAIQQASREERTLIGGIQPAEEELLKAREKKKALQSAEELHTFLMIEGDLEIEESPDGHIWGGWLEKLACSGQAVYTETGLWIAAEQKEEYEAALQWLGSAGKIAQGERVPETVCHILRRMLYYRGPADAEQICQRYAAARDRVAEALACLKAQDGIVETDGIFYHAKLYERAQKATLKGLRREVVTQPAEHFAALAAQRSRINAAPPDQLAETMRLYCGRAFPAAFWEEVLFPARVKNYRESMLDALLAEGDYFWHFLPDGRLCFEAMEDVDWESSYGPEPPSAEMPERGTGSGAGKAAETAETELQNPAAALLGDERILYDQLRRRGASFLKPLSRCLENGDARMALIGLAQRGLVYADSFVPVRQSLNGERIAKATVRQRVNVRVQAMSAGRWDLVRPCRKKVMEQWLEQLFMQNLIVCRETYRKPEPDPFREAEEGMSWSDALAVLRVWEYVGKVRRGYFVSGLSGAQFIRQEDYPAVTQALSMPGQEIIWLNAADPACVWGKVLPYPEKRDFTAVSSTAVALRGGRIAAVLERKGRKLRIFGEDCLEAVIAELALAFRERRLFAGQKRMVVREYPEGAGAFFKAAGFIREMQDYVLYLS